MREKAQGNQPDLKGWSFTNMRLFASGSHGKYLTTLILCSGRRIFFFTIMLSLGQIKGQHKAHILFGNLLGQVVPDHS